MALLHNDRWGGIAAFEAVGRRLSFNEAAKELGISSSAASRRITQLEERLGSRLLQRTTRNVMLTEAGEIYLNRCRLLIEQAQEMDTLVAGLQSEPQGMLRVSLPNLFGQKRIAPRLPDFMRRYPKVQLQVLLSDSYIDMVAQRIDAAVRIGDLEDADYVARRLAPNKRLLCAAPAYLEKAGTPMTPDELASHTCLLFNHSIDGQNWRLECGGKTHVVQIQSMLSTDNAEVLRQAVLAGQGIALLADFVVEEDLAAGRLVPVLGHWQAAESSVHIVYPSARYLPLKTRAFVDFMAEVLGAQTVGHTRQ